MSKNGKKDLVLFRKRLAFFVLFIGFLIFSGWAVSPFIKVGFNGTDSVDGTVFLIVKGQKVQKGELVAFWPPENDFYHNIWFVKYVRGIPGDAVTRNGRAFYINGEFIGLAKPESRTGIKLEASKPGLIPYQKIFVWTPHEDSFDSRYAQIGLVPEASVIGRAYRIF